MWSINASCGLLTVALLVAGTGARAGEAEDTELFEGDTLTREALVRAVLERNPGVESARHAWQAALAEAQGADRLPDPMVQVDVAPASVFDGPFGVGVTASQALPWPGKRELRRRMQDAVAEASRLGLEGTRLALALTASQLYDDYWLVGRALAINAEHRALLEDFRQVATSRFSTGHAALQDPLQAEAELANLESRDLALTSERRLVVAQLNRLLHRSPGAALPPPPATLVPAAAPRQVEKAEALENNPEVLAAKARMEAARTDSALAEKEGRPDFEVMTSYSNMWEHTSHRWMVGVGVNVPLWRDALKARRRAADERFAKAQSEIRQQRNDLLFEIDAAVLRVEEAERQLSLYRDRLLPTANERVKAARAGFETGRGSFLALIEAERNQRSVRLAHEEAFARLSKSRAELARALARFPVDEPDAGSTGGAR